MFSCPSVFLVMSYFWLIFLTFGYCLFPCTSVYLSFTLITWSLFLYSFLSAWFDFVSSPPPLDLLYIYPYQSVLSLICFSFWYSSHDCHMSPSVTWLHWFLFLIIWFLPVSVALCLMLWKAYTYKSGLFPLFYLLEIPLFIVLNSNDHFFLTSQTFGNNFFL